MDPLQLVGLSGLMALSSGRADLVVGLIDGPVELDHPDLATGNVRTFAGTLGGCSDTGDTSCRHGTFVAGILAARRGSQAPAIAPDCTLLIRPVFSDARPVGESPSATPQELAEAIVDCVDAGARVLNLSAALAGGVLDAPRDLKDALQYTARRGVLLVTSLSDSAPTSTRRRPRS